MLIRFNALGVNPQHPMAGIHSLCLPRRFVTPPTDLSTPQPLNFSPELWSSDAKRANRLCRLEHWPDCNHGKNPEEQHFRDRSPNEFPSENAVANLADGSATPPQRRFHSHSRSRPKNSHDIW
jgi:hypothetical protein